MKFRDLMHLPTQIEKEKEKREMREERRNQERERGKDIESLVD